MIFRLDNDILLAGLNWQREKLS